VYEVRLIRSCCLGIALVLLIACGGGGAGSKGSGVAAGGAGAGKDAGDASSALDLSGLWITNDLVCAGSKRKESVRIEQRNAEIVATKVVGDDCVPTGYVAFEGTLPKMDLTLGDLPLEFSVKGYGGDPGDPDSIMKQGMGIAHVTAADKLSLEFPDATYAFARSQGLGDQPLAAGSGGRAPGSTGLDAGVAGADVGAPRGGRGGNGGAGGQAGARAGTSGPATGNPGAGLHPAGRAGSDPAAAGGGGFAANGGGSAGMSVAGSAGRAGAEAGAGAGAFASAGRSGAAGSAGAGDGCDMFQDGASCDPVGQCGCLAGQNCRFDDVAPPACFPAGAIARGQPCVDVSDCVAGTTCVDNLCAKLCHNDSQCASASRCEPAGFGDVLVTGFAYCLEPCEPVLPIACYGALASSDPQCLPCGTGQACSPGSDVAFCFNPMLSAMLTPGSACTENDACLGGGCSEDVCRSWCRSATDCANPGETCALGYGVFAGPGDEIGLCLPPS
jgi:hypothetical protein